MSTVAEIKAAIEKLSTEERAELESLLRPDWEQEGGDCPPNVRERLAEAGKGRFRPGERSNVQKVLASLG